MSRLRENKAEVFLSENKMLSFMRSKSPLLGSANYSKKSSERFLARKLVVKSGGGYDTLDEEKRKSGVQDKYISKLDLVIK